MVASDECARHVWPAIAKRYPAANARHAEWIAERFGRNSRAMMFSEQPFEEHVLQLGDWVANNLKPPPFHEAATQSQRRLLATRTARAIEDLRDVLREVDLEEEGGLPQLSSELSRAQDKHFQATWDRLVQSESDPANERAPEIDLSESARMTASLVSSVGPLSPEIVLQCLESAITAWSAESPLVPRPGRPNAERLRFIRGMTSHFRKRYGTPLRAAVLAIAGCFFDCTDLSESDIAKLAP
jgi:hypothetical protein